MKNHLTTDAPESSYAFYSHITTGVELSYWSMKFSTTEQELLRIINITGPIVKDIHDYLQTLKPQYIPYLSSDEILCRFQCFIKSIMKGYMEDYETYAKGGGKESFHAYCWRLMMNETVEEITRIMEDHSDRLPNKEELLLRLQDVAKSMLLQSGPE